MGAVRATAYLVALMIAGASHVSSHVTSHAQIYPSGTVRIIVPYPPGGPTDIIARVAAQKLSEALGQQFYVENLSGASGARGAAMVATAPADGHTLMFITNDMAVTSTISTKIQYDPVKSFAPISGLSSGAQIVMVRNDLPVKTIPELIALARAQPGKLTFGCGYGSARGAAEQDKIMG